MAVYSLALTAAMPFQRKYNIAVALNPPRVIIRSLRNFWYFLSA